MKFRAVFFDGIMALLWAFACLLFLGTIGANILFIVLGLVSGVIYGSAVALKYIGSIEKNGEFRVTLKTWGFMILAIVIVVPISLYLFVSLGLEAGILMVNFIYPVLPAFYAARITLYLNWERKNARRIVFDGLLVLERVYATPELRGDTLRYGASEGTRCQACGGQLSPFDRAHVGEKLPVYFHEVRKWQRAYILSWISVLAFIALTFLNNVVYSNNLLGLLLSIGGVIPASFFFFTLFKLRSIAKKHGMSLRKTLPLYGIYPRREAQKLVIRPVARATGRTEKEIERRMKKR